MNGNMNFMVIDHHRIKPNRIEADCACLTVRSSQDCCFSVVVDWIEQDMQRTLGRT